MNIVMSSWPPRPADWSSISPTARAMRWPPSSRTHGRDWQTHEWSRGYTFPWVYLHRRHDRAVDRGWGWSGPRHRQDRFPPDDCRCRYKGYDSEQILSTSLFRLYLALGGDTVDVSGSPDRAARQRAADYAVYLILRTIKGMPAFNVGGMQTPDQFVTGLIDSDIATLPFTSPGPLNRRVGGWAHKVIRWAFEAQGLYAANPAAIVYKPGQSLPVDIFIDDNRSNSEGTYTRGGYMPVSLDWSGGLPKRWHASANAIKIVGNHIWVEVRNRGRTAANGVRVSVWYIAWPTTAGAPPEWGSTTGWTKIARQRPGLGTGLAGAGCFVRALRGPDTAAGNAPLDTGDRRLPRRRREHEFDDGAAVRAKQGLDRRPRGRRQQSRASGPSLALHPFAPGEAQDAPEGRAVDQIPVPYRVGRGLRRSAAWPRARPRSKRRRIQRVLSTTARSRRRASDWPASRTGSARRRAP